MRSAAQIGRQDYVVGRQLDVADEGAFRSLVDEVVERDGRLDMLFNNAGISMGGPTDELTSEHWNRIIEINLRGQINGVLAAYPLMMRQGGGHVVNTASGVGLVPPPYVVAYATTKHAVVGLSLGLRPEAALHGVKVSVLCPGAVETPILDRLPDADLPATASRQVTAREYLRVVHQKPMAADEFARKALRAVERNRAVIVVPVSAKALWYAHRLSPQLAQQITRVLARRVDRQLLRR
ncbi:MAG: short-chain dehydrogenase/reductase [Ilumatobacteraceae bacterium]|nr:short-chain dehydrogenase/reductase [Ilumatobacteraceae bacterium]